MASGEELCYKGWQHQFGIDVEKDFGKAFEYYKQAADLDNGEGLFWTGFCYNWGIGVNKDDKEAFKHYLRSAETGYYNGIYKTAICFKFGIGIEEDKDKHKEWFNKDSLKQVRFYAERDSEAKCEICNNFKTGLSWCITCYPDMTIQSWTSRDKKIDDLLKFFQLRTCTRCYLVKWIPFEKLVNIEKIGEGGFGSVFSAIMWNNDLCEHVALKTIQNFKEVSLFNSILNSILQMCLCLILY
ncbi:hypothetical protein C2G38_277178 [Gigaspora rosea]|uniref:Protein kinase domain-containing protein n=1 Tax=Gigaspora rosea TaxID=44941 RepID=A0A397VUR8_9GLOM|nr:hypothetical protein C2G38_277178 [Gigaspora rosea]